ncbi:ABC transporter ATP-binding protein [Tateyamaria omphalii]|uniref:ABC transporter ATP-binding protein n=1 Tax=Tateyamaria omphalii TaxID=299262 RepID=UPI001C98FA88|nr:ABC transporter ATP-binding protein [Tateyamaria omphalii]MBY5932700.1 ABC transporter ATP-binding protein [Tateyamaria omphalii]
MSNPALSADGLSMSFGGHNVVRDMSLNVGTGELVGLIGPNGAGKTTMFNLLAGTLRPKAGVIRLAGEDVTDRSQQGRCGSGLSRSFQIPKPFARMTVLENVMTSAQGQVGENVLSVLIRPGAVAAQERANVARARALIDFVSLSHLEDRPASVLSGGQRKLLELARVLMTEPKVILLDEPAAGVNPALLDLIIDRIADINSRGISILLIEHNMDMIARLCSRVVVMAAGRLLAEGAPQEVTRRPEVVDVYLDGMPS